MTADWLIGRRSVVGLMSSINRVRFGCVSLSIRVVSGITSPCLFVGLLLHSHESESQCYAHITNTNLSVWLRRDAGYIEGKDISSLIGIIRDQKLSRKPA